MNGFYISIEILWYILGALLSALPIPCIKKYLNGDGIIWIVLAIIMNVLLIYIYYLLFEKYTIGVAYSIIKILSIVLVVLIGIFVYYERINVRIVFGLIFGMVALYLLA